MPLPLCFVLHFVLYIPLGAPVSYRSGMAAQWLTLLQQKEGSEVKPRFEWSAGAFCVDFAYVHILDKLITGITLGLRKTSTRINT